MIEEWRDIKGYEGLYQVSNTGKIKRLHSTVLGKDGKTYIAQERILANRYNKGYASVQLSKYGKSKQLRVHRLVAQAFIPNPNNYPIINHKDENPSNNNIDNLEWCTPKYNTNYGNCKRKMSEKAKLHTGENNNFYGKHHSESVKRRISEHRKGKLVGKNNPMITHNIDFSGENNPMYGKKHSDDVKARIGKKSKERFADNPRIWVKKGDVGKFILKSEQDEYFAKGYIIGRPYKKRHRKKEVNNEN